MKVTWNPRYSITDEMASDLMTIEKIKTLVESAQISLGLLAAIRERVRIRSTHFSTQIEGNRLTLEEAREVIQQRKVFERKAKDTKEVKNYWDALLKIEEWAQEGRAFDEGLMKKTHAIVEKGLRARPTPYRTEQNVIRDSSTNAIIYLPPEAKDVPELMKGLVDWENDAQKMKIPVPLIAALVHYQFVTIHPFYDGNGRTARLLSTFILHRGGYGLNGIFSLEEYHARDLQLYYKSLMTHPHHNYYEGRDRADITGWVSYFVELLAGVFEAAGKEMLTEEATIDPVLLRKLDHRQRIVVDMLAVKDSLSVRELSVNLGLSDRMVRNLVKKWIEEGFLRVINPSNKNRKYGLSEIYRQFIGNR